MARRRGRFLIVLGEATADWQSKRREAARQEILSAAWAVARENGLAALTLREVAARVGMRAPSLYSHFASKHAIYDAMFGQAWLAYEAETNGVDLPRRPRAVLRVIARVFFDFAVADLPRHQLMSLRTIPGFTPTPENYAPAVRVMERLRSVMGGTRYARLLDRAVDMYADALHLPQVTDDREEP
jgi:AcrR family transcriptional regulator